MWVLKFLERLFMASVLTIALAYMYSCSNKNDVKQQPASAQSSSAQKGNGGDSDSSTLHRMLSK